MRVVIQKDQPKQFSRNCSEVKEVQGRKGTPSEREIGSTNMMETRNDGRNIYFPVLHSPKPYFASGNEEAVPTWLLFQSLRVLDRTTRSTCGLDPSRIISSRGSSGMFMTESASCGQPGGRKRLAERASEHLGLRNGMPPTLGAR